MTHTTHQPSPARMILVVGLYLFLTALGVSSAETAGEPPSSTYTPTATASNTPNPSDTPTPTATPSHTPTPDAKPPPSSPTPTDTATATPSPTNTSTETATPTQTPQASHTPSPTSTASETPSQTPSPTTTATTTPSATATPSPVASKPPGSYPPQSVLIHEVAWAGTLASAYDEWVELHNPGATPIDLTGWHLVLGEDNSIILLGTLPAYGFYLMERTDDGTVADIPADLIYTGGLKNSGDRLRLFDPSGNLVDSADYAGGWPAGEAISRFTMERLGGADVPGNWVTFSGSGGNGVDAAGNPIPGTPRQPNSIFAPTATPTATPTPTTTSAPNPYPPQSVLINEIAWAGTLASANDEWIELYNPGAEDINLLGWTLTDDNDINIALSGVVLPYSFYLLERSDDTSVADISADRIYTGCLSNGGETLYLFDPTGNLVDSANLSGSGWPAGEVTSRASMERRGGKDSSGNWGTFTGYYGVGHDANGNPIPGTPRTTNSLFFPTPVPTWIPSRVVINEVLIRPHYDWEGDGDMSTDDEFIEIYNRGPSTVNIQGWFLDDIPDGGSRPFELPSMKLHPGDFAVFFRSQTRIALNDTGDTVRLLAQNGRTLDQIQYLKVRAYNLSYGCLPDGRKYLFYGLWPTPGGPNELFEEPTEETYMPLDNIHIQLARLGRLPSLVCWVNALGYVSLSECPAEH